MSRDHLAALAEVASDVTFPARQRLFEDGGNATRFWLLQSGHPHAARDAIEAIRTIPAHGMSPAHPGRIT